MKLLLLINIFGIFCLFIVARLYCVCYVHVETVAMLNVRKHKAISEPQRHPHTPQADHKHSHQHSHTHSHMLKQNTTAVWPQAQIMKHLHNQTIQPAHTL